MVMDNQIRRVMWETKIELGEEDSDKIEEICIYLLNRRSTQKTFRSTWVASMPVELEIHPCEKY
jgi:hypothetical protein